MVEHLDTFWVNAETAEIYEGGRLSNIISERNSYYNFLNCVYYPECRGSSGQGNNTDGTCLHGMNSCVL